MRPTWLRHDSVAPKNPVFLKPSARSCNIRAKQIAAAKEQDIDLSDIPELDGDFWRNAEMVEPDRTEQITLRVKRSVLACFRASGKGYQSRMNRVLESYVRAQRK